jgi:stromal membrane-associated protein
MGDELQKQLRKRLENLLKHPENQICSDCGKRGPRWASVNLGVFFCIDCSGIHRNLGVHISFVRSINLDSWKVEQVEKMEQWGNKRANEYYEANLPPNVQKPKDGDSVKVVEKFIRDKYEHKRYIAKSIPPRVESDNNFSDNSNDNRGNNGNRNEPITRQRPSTKASAPVAKAPPAPAPALIDFMDMSAPP